MREEGEKTTATEEIGGNGKGNERKRGERRDRRKVERNEEKTDLEKRRQGRE